MSDEELEELKEFTIYLNDIDDLALGLEICSKKSNMVIQEFIDTIVQLQQENKKYKETIDKLKKCINDFPAIHYSSIEKVNKKGLSGKLIPVDELLDILNEVE